MELKITPQNWQAVIKDRTNVIAVNYDFLLIEDLKLLPKFNFPFKINIAIVVICTNGSARGKIGLKSFTAEAPCLYHILPDQTIQQEFISDDFNGYAIVMSQRFIDSLFHEPQRQLAIMRYSVENQCYPMNREDLRLFITYYKSMKQIAGLTDNLYRLEILRHLTLVIFYVSDHYNKWLPEKTATTPQALLANRFMELVKENFKRERQMSFYAGKLCLTPKYLSLKIREITGKSAADWIDDFVILEAKALLKSTHMTVQQISDELNFPSQSFFGKYFKRLAGVSPNEYRKKV